MEVLYHITIFCGDIPLGLKNKPNIYGRYLQFKVPEIDIDIITLRLFNMAMDNHHFNRLIMCYLIYKWAFFHGYVEYPNGNHYRGVGFYELPSWGML